MILDHDDVVSAYAEAFERYDVAAGIISRVCEYLNKIITQSNNTKLPIQNKRQTVGNSIYKRQTVQAVCNSQLHIELPTTSRVLELCYLANESILLTVFLS